jgi:hypothetical protein
VSLVSVQMARCSAKEYSLARQMIGIFGSTGHTVFLNKLGKKLHLPGKSISVNFCNGIFNNPISKN